MCSIEITFPQDRISVDQKREYLLEIYDWGVDNLDDPNDKWVYFKLAIDNARLRVTTERVEFEIDSDIDSMALKLTWS